MIRLKQARRSGHVYDWGVYHINIGISQPTFKKLFKQAVEEKLIFKTRRGYRFRNFKGCLHKIYGMSGTFIQVFDKQGTFNTLVNNVLKSVALHRLHQQYNNAKRKLLEFRNTCGYVPALIRAGNGDIKFSARSISRYVGCSHSKANDIINWLRKKRLIMLKKVNKGFLRCKSLYLDYWFCQRFLLKVDWLRADNIESSFICK